MNGHEIVHFCLLRSNGICRLLPHIHPGELLPDLSLRLHGIKRVLLIPLHLRLQVVVVGCLFAKVRPEFRDDLLVLFREAFNLF